MLKDHKFGIDVVYADGNPCALLKGLTAKQAIADYATLRAERPTYHCFVGIYSEDDPERGWFDDGSLSDALGDEEYDAYGMPTLAERVDALYPDNIEHAGDED